MSDFKVGDRVRYTGRRKSYSKPENIGQLGTVDREPTSPHVISVLWDNECGMDGVYPENLELIMPNIDTSKPLEFFSGTNSAPAPFITETSEGHIMVGGNKTTDNLAQSLVWAIFTKQGKFVRSDTERGTGLGLRNKVERSVIYQRIAQVEQGYIMAGAYETERGARMAAGKQIVRVSSENGVVVSVELLS